jgi:ubiquinone/menaquinone biosynthesis C-methylase UbiE
LKTTVIKGGKPLVKMGRNLDKYQCPICRTENLGVGEGQVTCRNCGQQYEAGENWVDFVGASPEGKVAFGALETWGKGLHTKTPMEQCHELHFPQFLEAFGNEFDFPAGSDVLEMGCGAGADSLNLALARPDLNLWACDLGENIPRLAEQARAQSNLSFFRADCRKMPVRSRMFNRIVSFGVFHHTADPGACVREMARVLTRNGRAFVYLYKDHEDNAWKRMGVRAESVLMKTLARLPRPWARLFCRAMTFPCLLLFSWPAQLMKIIPCTGQLGRAMPMHWGTTPRSIQGDLEDRLLAPVNHRFSRREFEDLFRSAGLQDVRVVTTTFGHYGMAVKQP